MDIPGNELRIKNKAIQDRIKVGSKSSSAKSGGDSASSTNVQGSDTTAFSDQAKAIQQAISTVKNSQDVVRAEKVDRIKKELADGSFKIDSVKVAEKLLEDAIKESQFLG
jgi:flagellar biosynthesis anti-sigma factor FlgM